MRAKTVLHGSRQFIEPWGAIQTSPSVVADLIVGSIELGLIPVEPDERLLGTLGRGRRRRLMGEQWVRRCQPVDRPTELGECAPNCASWQVNRKAPRAQGVLDNLDWQRTTKAFSCGLGRTFGRA